MGKTVGLLNVKSMVTDIQNNFRFFFDPNTTL
jgi:hypothetical protein